MGDSLATGYYLNFGIGDGFNDGNRSNALEIWSYGTSAATGSAILLDTGSLPTSDPGIVGQLYRTGSNSDEIRISLG